MMEFVLDTVNHGSIVFYPTIRKIILVMGPEVAL